MNSLAQLPVRILVDEVNTFSLFRATDTCSVFRDDGDFRRKVTVKENPVAPADELRRRRQETGVSYYAFGANVADTFAPLVAELAAR